MMTQARLDTILSKWGGWTHPAYYGVQEGYACARNFAMTFYADGICRLSSPRDPSLDVLESVREEGGGESVELNSYDTLPHFPFVDMKPVISILQTMDSVHISTGSSR